MKDLLIIWCGVKFLQGHNYIRSQLYHILMDDTNDHKGELEELLDYMESMEKWGIRR